MIDNLVSDSVLQMNKEAIVRFFLIVELMAITLNFRPKYGSQNLFIYTLNLADNKKISNIDFKSIALFLLVIVLSYPNNRRIFNDVKIAILCICISIKSQSKINTLGIRNNKVYIINTL